MRIIIQVIVGLFILVVPMQTSNVNYVYFQDEHPFQAGELVIQRNKEEEMYL